MIILLMTLIFNGTSFADDIFDVAEEYNYKKKRVISLESTRRGMLSEVYDLEKKTKKIVEEKSNLNNKNAQLKVSLKKVSKEIVGIETEIYEMTPQLHKRLSFVHKIQDLPWMYAFLSAYSVTELDRLVKTFDNINNQEAQITIDYFGKLEELKKKKIELNQIAKDMVHLNKEIAKKETAIKDQHFKKKKLLKTIESNIHLHKTELTKIKKKGRNLAKSSDMADLSMLFGTAFFDKKGELPHPIDAPIAHGFGLNQPLLVDHVELLHKGYFYKAAVGRDVKSIDAGRVKIAQFVPGFGNMVIIDHGGRYYSVYGNLKKIKVKVDQVIKPKEMIATTGDLSLQFGEGLYFEIRHFSEPENPEKWLKAQEKQLAGI